MSFKIEKPILFYLLVVAIFSLGLKNSIVNKELNNNVDNKKTNSFNVAYSIKPVPIPENITFAGEQVPVHNFDTYESLDREMLINTYWQSQTVIFIKRAYRYFPVIEKILKEEGVPDDFKYLAVAESGLSNVVSPAGAAGFWQFLKGTASDHNLIVNGEVDERYNLEKSTHAAAQYLKKSYEKFGSWTLAAAAYNMGRRNISKQIARQKSDNYYDLVLGEETGRYVFRIIAIKLILENPDLYGFHIADKDRYQPLPYEVATIDSSIISLPNFAHSLGINYKVLKELNPWLRDNKLTNSSRKKYNIKIAKNDYREILENPRFFPK